MGNLNKVFILGRLGKDAEKRVTNTGKEMLTFSVATSRFWKGQDGERQESTEWHRVVYWARREGGLDRLQQFLVKGQEVHIEGELRTRQWEKDGQNHERTEVNAQRVELTGSRRSGNSQEDSDPYPASRGGDRGYSPSGSAGSNGAGGGGYHQGQSYNQGSPPPTPVDMDDIPF